MTKLGHLGTFLLKVELERSNTKTEIAGDPSSLWKSTHVFDPVPLILTAAPVPVPSED